MNEEALMAEFAENLWRNYIKPKVEQTRTSVLSFYVSEVVSNNSDGTLTVQSQFDNERTINKTSQLEEVESGAKVVVVKCGNGNAAMNHLALMAYNDDGRLTFVAD